MLLKNAWYIAAWADEVKGEPVARRICDEPIVLFRDSAGRAAALADRCCHRSAPLGMGRVVEEGLECGYHGLVFEGSGHCVRIPGQLQMPEGARVRSYPVVEKDALLWVWTGDPAKADPARVLDFPYHNDKARWPNKHDVYPIKANYMLMVDNLMDLTHLGYLHAKTVGGNPLQHFQAEMQTARTPTGLKFTRWMKNSVPPPSYVKAAGFKGRVDRCQEFEFVAPASVLQWTGATDAGTATTDPQRDFRFQFRLFHGLTPETETSCFYFWSAANGYRQNEPEATEQLYQEIAPTFVEDRVMVEAQQRRLDEFGEAGLVDIASDGTRMQMRRMVERLIREEAPSLAAEWEIAMSVRLVVTITAAPGKGAEFARAFKPRCEESRKDPGCLQFEIFQSAFDPDKFALLELWESEEALAAHAKLQAARPPLPPGLRAGAGEREDYVYNRTR